jgi:hypothetical protein
VLLRLLLLLPMMLPPLTRRCHLSFPQDPHRVPPWYQPTLMSYQSFHHRYVIEDRFSGEPPWGHLAAWREGLLSCPGALPFALRCFPGRVALFSAPQPGAHDATC